MAEPILETVETVSTLLDAEYTSLKRGAKELKPLNATTVDTGLKVGPRRVITVQLRSQNNLSYRFDFSAM